MRKPITWPEDRGPTPTEWVEWFNSHELEDWEREDGEQISQDQLDISEMLLAQLQLAANTILENQALRSHIQKLEMQLQGVNQKSSQFQSRIDRGNREGKDV